jgi:hypothetical protein
VTVLKTAREQLMKKTPSTTAILLCWEIPFDVVAGANHLFRHVHMAIVWIHRCASIEVEISHGARDLRMSCVSMAHASRTLAVTKSVNARTAKMSIGAQRINRSWIPPTGIRKYLINFVMFELFI